MAEMDARIWWIHAKEQRGPYSRTELGEFAAAGTLTPTDSVWKEGLEHPAPAASLAGVFKGAPKLPAPGRRPGKVDRAKMLANSAFLLFLLGIASTAFMNTWFFPSPRLNSAGTRVAAALMLCWLAAFLVPASGASQDNRVTMGFAATTLFLAFVGSVLLRYSLLPAIGALYTRCLGESFSIGLQVNEEAIYKHRPRHILHNPAFSLPPNWGLEIKDSTQPRGSNYRINVDGKKSAAGVLYVRITVPPTNYQLLRGD